MALVASPPVAFGPARIVATPAVALTPPAAFTAPPVAFKDYPYGPDEGHWVTIDGEHVLIRGARPGEHEHGRGEHAPEPIKRPAGPAVSEALRVQKSKHLAPVHEVTKAIDAVHGDGALPNIPVKTSQARGFYGIYRGDAGRPERSSIAISTVQAEDHKHLTAAHEIGHFLDHQALKQPGGSFGSWSTKEPEMAALMQTIGETQAVKSLKAQRGVNGDVTIEQPDGTRKTYSPNSGYLGYLLKSHEQFARAYAQYVATRSGHPELKRELEDQLTRQNDTSTPIRYTTQWEHADFAPVAQRFDQLFEARGWRK